MTMIDKMSYSSRLRYISPCIKASFAVTTLLICVTARSFIISLITLAVMGSLTVYKGGTSVTYYIKLYRIPILFLLLSTFTIIINIADEPLSKAAIPVFQKYLTFSEKGLHNGGNLIMTAIGAVSCLYFLSLTTPITDLLYVLEIIHCPYILTELLLLIYRFIFVFYDMAAAITISQKSRLSNKNLKTSIRAMSGMLVMLLIRALRNSSVLYDAMESRCYDGKLQVLREAAKASKREMIMVLTFEVILLVIWLF